LFEKRQVFSSVVHVCVHPQVNLYIAELVLGILEILGKESVEEISVIVHSFDFSTQVQMLDPNSAKLIYVFQFCNHSLLKENAEFLALSRARDIARSFREQLTHILYSGDTHTTRQDAQNSFDLTFSVRMRAASGVLLNVHDHWVEDDGKYSAVHAPQSVIPLSNWEKDVPSLLYIQKPVDKQS